MTDSILTTALVGTAQRAPSEPAGETPTDALVQALPATERERTLLLQAGCMAIYTQAGAHSTIVSDLPDPTPDERLSAGSPAAANLLRQLLSEPHSLRDALLQEALDRLAAAGLRLPYDLLPAALDLRTSELRAIVARVAGERGRWLSRFNPAWSWLCETLAEAAELDPTTAETVWQEGTTAQRIAVLRQLRTSDPARARDQLAAVWKREKAEVRADLLGAVEIGLSADDEAFLEAALDDKSVAVRAVAASLLTHIPASALAARMRERAATMLTFADGKLNVSMPAALDNDTIRDGIVEKPPRGTGERAWWLAQIIRCVPPSYWLEHFNATPETLIAAASASKWRSTLLEAWTRAAVTFDDLPWLTPLWSYWLQAAREKEDVDPDEMRALLAPRVSPAALEEWALSVITDPAADNHPEALAMLPRPWSVPVTRAYLAGLRAFAGSLTNESSSADPWDDTFHTAARAIPPECFAEALEPIDLPRDNRQFQIAGFRRQLDTFVETMRTRQRIHKEIPA